MKKDFPHDWSRLAEVLSDVRDEQRAIQARLARETDPLLVWIRDRAGRNAQMITRALKRPRSRSGQRQQPESTPLWP
jgi:hypothetical protein